MQVRKAVITAAGRSERSRGTAHAVPGALLPFVDRDGQTKPVLQIIAEEAIESGIEQICVVAAPGDDATIRRAFTADIPSPPVSDAAGGGDPPGSGSQVGRRLHVVVQERPAGYGHAVWCARAFVGAEPFLLLVSDHLYISNEERRCARQVLDLASQQDCAVAAVQATREHVIHRYGTVAGKRLPGHAGVFQIEQILEKPTPSVAEQRLQVPGLRVGHYLCFFGMHVLTPRVFEILDREIGRDRSGGGTIELTPALQELARCERYLAAQANGRRHDIGAKYGLLEAQFAFAMAGVDRDVMLARAMELLLQFEVDHGPRAHRDDYQS